MFMLYLLYEPPELTFELDLGNFLNNFLILFDITIRVLLLR